MFAYCNNNPANNLDSSGTLPAPVIKGLIQGLVSGVTNMICAWATGSDGSEVIAAFSEGFVRGFTLGALSYTKYLKYIANVGSVLWDVGSAVYNAWTNDATFGECVAIGWSQLYAALAFVSAPDSIALDLSVKLGTSLVATSIYEGFTSNNYERISPVTAAVFHKLKSHTDVRNGGGALLVSPCCIAYGH